MYISITTIISFIIVIISSLAILVIFYLKREGNIAKILDKLMHKTQSNKVTIELYLGIMRNSLKKLNIKYEKVTLNEGKDMLFTFEYQSGNFSLFIPMSDTNVKGFSLHYPYIYIANLDKLQAIRTTCNEANNTSSIARAVYFIDDEKNQIYVHLACHIPFTILSHELTDNLTDAMQECFVLQRIIDERVDQLDKQMIETRFSDLEYAQSNLLEQNNWINEVEARHSQNEMSFNANHLIQSTEECLLGEWLNTQEILPPESKLLEMKCESDDGYQFSTMDPNSILHYALTTPIIHQLQQDQAPKAQNGSIKIAYQRKNEINSKRTHWLTLYIENLGVNEHIVYIRINYMLPEKSTNPQSEFQSANGYTRVTGGSFVIGYDWKDGHRKQVEFDYLWKDAQDKIKEGKTDEWSPEQELIHTITHAELGYDIYWGKRFARQKRYYEAALHLSRAYNRLNNEFYTSDKKQQSIIFEVCFILGHCYIKMKQFKTAFFYLHILSGSNQTNHIEEMITCLVALKDFRSEQALEFYSTNVKTQIQEYLENEREVPEHLQEFYDFLRRQDVYINIERHFFEKAQKICSIMLNEDENKDFALNELRHIQRLREKGVQELTPTLNPPIENLF